MGDGRNSIQHAKSLITLTHAPVLSSHPIPYYTHNVAVLFSYVLASLLCNFRFPRKGDLVATNSFPNVSDPRLFLYSPSQPYGKNDSFVSDKTRFKLSPLHRSIRVAGSHQRETCSQLTMAEVDDQLNLNKAEKKARKALEKLGLKKVSGVKRVTMKKSPNVLFLIESADVYKSPSAGNQETFVVYGEAKIDDGTGKGMSSAPQQPRSAPAPVARQVETAAEDASGLQENDIQMVVDQAGVSRANAIAALRKNDGDIVNSIMDLTM